MNFYEQSLCLQLQKSSFTTLNFHSDPFGSGSELIIQIRIRILQNVWILLDPDQDPQHF